ncbi:hypothetical protein VULLAG_LOCUS4488 [Vulpes lagopus]
MYGLNPDHNCMMVDSIEEWAQTYTPSSRVVCSTNSASQG